MLGSCGHSGYKINLCHKFVLFGVSLYDSVFPILIVPVL